MNLTKEELNTLDNALIEYNIVVNKGLADPNTGHIHRKNLERERKVLGPLMKKVSAAMIAAQNEDRGAFRGDGAPLTVTAENLPDGLEVKGSGIQGSVKKAPAFYPDISDAKEYAITDRLDAEQHKANCGICLYRISGPDMWHCAKRHRVYQEINCPDFTEEQRRF